MRIRIQEVRLETTVTHFPIIYFLKRITSEFEREYVMKLCVLLIITRVTDFLKHKE